MKFTKNSSHRNLKLHKILALTTSSTDMQKLSTELYFAEGKSESISVAF